VVARSTCCLAVLHQLLAIIDKRAPVINSDDARELIGDRDRTAVPLHGLIAPETLAEPAVIRTAHCRGDIRHKRPR